MELVYIPTVDELISGALRQGRYVTLDTSIRNPIKRRRDLYARRHKLIAETLMERLAEISAILPNIDTIHPFYRELIDVSISICTLKKSLAHVSQSRKLIKKIFYETRRKLFLCTTDETIKKIDKEFFGRVLSVIKKLSPTIEFLRDATQQLSKFPNVKFDTPTVILAGAPNVGKTTILYRLTGSKAKVANYPFTTTELNVAYFEYKFLVVQVIDVPGLLDRPFDKKNVIEKKAIAALQHLADIIVFILDASESCGYSYSSQLNLLKLIKAKFSKVKFLLVINKTDLLDKNQIEKLKLEHKEAIFEGEAIPSTLKEEIVKVLQTAKAT